MQVSDTRDGDSNSKAGNHMNEVYIIDAVRTPIGKYGGALSSVRPDDLLAHVIRSLLERNKAIDPHEIEDEVVLINKQCEKTYSKKLSNIVFMGMGEPLLNYKNVLKAIEKITAEDGLSMSPRWITVSTAGVAKMIRQLGDDKVRFKLALSLHAANDLKRNEIMPINETNNLKALIDALNHFYRETKNEITLEYILFNNFNDSNKDADELIKFYRQVPADLVNIIEYNPIDFAKFEKPSEEKTAQFMNYLAKNKVNSRLRRSRGKDIDAACGQLANKN